MVVGKTSSNISKDEIFNKFSETQILQAVFPEIKTIPCKINSPFRIDTNPSFSIYLNNDKHIRYKDFGDSSMKGGLLDLLCQYWNCSFPKALDNICKLMIKDTDISVTPKTIKTLTQKEIKQYSKLQVVVRPWRNYDLQYWASYGVTKKWLKYADVYPISHKIIIKSNPTEKTNKTYTFPADKYAYCFVEHKENNIQLKIYQPFNTKGYKWCSKMDASVIGLWSKIPEYGDRVVVCSSLKDALCISCNLHIPTLCLQGEGYSISDTAVKELKRRYKKIFISFDTDKAGITDSTKLSEQTGFINIIPNLGAEKDFSDYYKSLDDKSKFQQLKTLFI